MEEEAWSIVLEGRRIIRSGGRLHSKGSAQVPSRLRKSLLNRIDREIPVIFKSEAAMLPGSKTHIEHVTPMKRIAIEIIDPSAHDPRTVGGGPAGLGPARDLLHAVEIARTMIVKALVTQEEHALINRSGVSLQWDAPAKDILARYHTAGVCLVPVD